MKKRVRDLMPGDICENRYGSRLIVLGEWTVASKSGVRPYPGDKTCAYLPSLTRGVLFYDEEVELLVRAR